jgi:DNA-binding SARP family transcriptional activator
VSIEIRLLGRFRALRDGEEIPPGAFRQRLVRILIRILVSRRGEFVSRDFLTEALWPRRPPADPRANLRVLVTLARRALGDSTLLQAGPGGYAFSTSPTCVVDAEVFVAELQVAQEAMARGSHEDALRAFRSALQMWGGEPLAEDAYDDWAQDCRNRLLRAHLHALEGGAASALEVGEPGDAVVWAEQAAAREPLRERAHALLVEALATSGDTAGALAVYEDFRRRLAKDLGLDPSAEAQELQGRILRGQLVHRDAQRAASSSGRTSSERAQAELPLPSELAVESSRSFVGRSTELHTAENLLSRAGQNRLAALWLLGEPGIGKTRLAAEIARRVHASGGVALFGRCNEDLAVPYQPFLEALQWYVAHVPTPELANRLGHAPGELSRLVPEIGDRAPGLPAPQPGGAEIEQHRLFEAVRTWLATAGGDRPLVMVLDDIHWATRPTLALLRHVARSAEPSTALLVCTARNTSPDGNEAVATVVDELVRRGAPTRCLELSGLDVEAVRELVASVAGQGLDDDRLRSLAKEVHGETAGNPLFVHSLLAGLSADPERHPALERSLAEAVVRRVARLPGDVVGLLRTASVAGLDFDLRVIARAAERGELAALEALETAARAGLVEEKGPNRYRFRHALVRSALREQLSQSRRVRVHLQVGEALEAVHRDRLDDQVNALAYHFSQAVPVGAAHRAYRYTVLAAERATAFLSHDEAVEAYGQALELLDEVDGMGPLARYDLLFVRSEAQRKAGDIIGALDTLRAAVEEAATQGAAQELARAAIAFEETSFWLGSSGERALELVEQAERALPEEDSSLRALTLASVSRALDTSGQPEGIERGHEAQAIAERLRDPLTSFGVLLRTSRSTLSVEQAEACARRWMQVCRKAREIGDLDAHLLALAQTMWATVMLGDLATWDDLFAEYASLAGQLRQPRWEYWLDLFRALRAFLAADLQAAEQLLQRAEHIGEGFGWAREGLYGVTMFLIRREQGRLAGLAPALRAAVRLNPDALLWGPGLAALYTELGRLDDARREFEAVLSAGLTSFPTDGSRELCVGLLAEVCAELGDEQRAPWLLEQLRPCQGKFLVFLASAVSLGPADRLLGMLASTADRSEDAERWHRAGLQFARNLDSPMWIGHCLYDYAVHLMDSDRSEAERMLAEAAAICDKHNLPRLRQRVGRLRAAG